MKPSLKQHLNTVTVGGEGTVVLTFKPRPRHTLEEIEPEVEAFAASIGSAVVHTDISGEGVFQVDALVDVFSVWEW